MLFTIKRQNHKTVMKHKTFILAGLCALGISTLEVQAINHDSAPFLINGFEQNMPNRFDRIDLLGDLLYSVGPNSIEAGVSKDEVCVQFNQNVGSVNVSLYKEGILVYSAVIDTSVQQTVIIPITTNGSYTVEVSNATGYAEGDFDRN